MIIRGVSGVRDGDVTFYTFYRVGHNLQKGDRKREKKELDMFVLNVNDPNTVISQINDFAIVKIVFSVYYKSTLSDEC